MNNQPAKSTTKAIIFDFDGVICESVDIKTDAFRRLFESYPHKIEQILDYHMRNGGISRYEKFQVIYRDFLEKELSVEKLESLGQKFSQYSYESVIRAPLVAGAYEFLQNNLNKYHFFIASGTPEPEIRSIVHQKKLEGFFKAVYGSPRKKDALITTILIDNGFKPDEAVFVGDSMTDYEGAKSAGISFIGRVPLGEKNPFMGLPIRGLIQDLSALETFLQEESESNGHQEVTERLDP